VDPSLHSTRDETRKVVTVVFADVVDSTPLATRLDPESLRRLMFRYFEEMKRVVESHGGAVEKFIGDALLAVFGIPRAHEDDALRAVSTAVEMRKTLAQLNEEFERVWGVSVGVRTGLDTGEVVAGAPEGGELFVTGETVNTAARLEGAASEGEILLGERTYRLVRQFVVAEPVGPLALKGLAESTPSWRLIDLLPQGGVATRRLDSPIVGRERELGRLRAAYEAGMQGCSLLTVMGPAGVGKSRLAREFLAGIADEATVAHGRCLPYGDGITFWPVVAVLRDLAGVEAADPEEARRSLHALLADHPEGALVAGRLAALLGTGGAAPGIQETFWAVRKLLEHVARHRPLVVVFDDIHWGEPTFLDLIEYLTEWIRSGRVFLLCLARPELLEVRPEWAAGKENATSISLRPLGAGEIRTLMENLVEGAQLSEPARERIASVAEGNPLFVEETLRMLVDDGVLQPVDGGWVATREPAELSIPDTIHALLAARLDRLAREERSVIERASVIGRVFSWGEVGELSPDEARSRLAGDLQSLMRKELIRPDYSESAHEDSFRFAHILIRDAAYRGLAKAVRAELHQRLAEFIERTAAERTGEFEELAGYHFEQAFVALQELGIASAQRTEVAARAARQLATAGQRAFARGDMPAAVKLLTRADGLLAPDDRLRVEVLPPLAFALMETGQFERLMGVVEETQQAAARSGDPRLQAHAIILGLWIRLFTEPEGWTEEAERSATEAMAAFEQAGDERGLTRAWSLLGLVQMMKTQFAPAEEAWAEAAAHAAHAGDERDELESLAWVPLTIWAGPTQSERGLDRCRELLARVDGDKKAMSSALMAAGTFEAELGAFDAARADIARAKQLVGEISLAVWQAGPLAQCAGWVELLAADGAAAERELRPGYEALSRIGEMSWLSTVAGMLAEAVVLQGRDAEAEELAGVGRAAAAPDDAFSQTVWRTVLAKVRARGRAADEAARLAEEAVAIADRSDFLHLRWHALMTLSEVLEAGGRREEAADAAERARGVAVAKGSIAGERRAEEVIERLAPERSAARRAEPNDEAARRGRQAAPTRD
jgi:class 3 adenylate cyclase